jgi:hypothetical protein
MNKISIDTKQLDANNIKVAKETIRGILKRSIALKDIDSFSEKNGKIKEIQCKIIGENVSRMLNTVREKSIWTCVNMDTLKHLEVDTNIVIEIYKQGVKLPVYTGIGDIKSTTTQLTTANMFFNTKKRLSVMVSPKKNVRIAKQSSVSSISKLNTKVHTLYKVNTVPVKNIDHAECSNIFSEFCNGNNYTPCKQQNKFTFEIKPSKLVETSVGNFIVCAVHNKCGKDPGHFAMIFIKCQQLN